MSLALLATQKSHPSAAISAEVVNLSKHFGSLVALDRVSLKIEAGTLHALLGENGAGKSTLVKCLMGFYQATSGQLMVDGQECDIPDPRAAHSLGLGMVYQHFTLVPSLTATENLVINRPDCPALINWDRERAALSEFLTTMPFRIPLDVPVNRLASGQKQKLEIIKQLYLNSRFLILDEPTSVLTPGEAIEVLTLVRALCEQQRLTVLMITHKFREVTAFADTVSVLRQGRYTGGGKVADLSHQDMASLMMGDAGQSVSPAADPKMTTSGTPDKADSPIDSNTVLQLQNIRATSRSGNGLIFIDSLGIAAGEIVGVAGVSGNGQSELMEILSGQRSLVSGDIQVDGKPYTPNRKAARIAKVRYLPEEPLSNACAARMSVAENMAFRSFDEDACGKPTLWLNNGAMRRNAEQLITDFNVRTPSHDAPIESLSGGNVQRAVLARELTGNVRLLIASNPCFGLDFTAVAEIRERLRKARALGTAILLLSEDLDEILDLADRIVVMSEGSINYSCSIQEANIATIGHYMAGQDNEDAQSMRAPD